MTVGKNKLTERILHDTAKLAGFDLDETRTVLLLPPVERMLENLARLNELDLLEREPASTFRFAEEE